MAKYYYESPIGLLELIISEKGVQRLVVTDGAKEEPMHVAGAIHIHLTEALQWLNIYFSGQAPVFLPALDLQGTPFQQIVWQKLLTIPYGETITYGELAQAVASVMGVKRMAAQAVGGAVGRNPVLLMVPCHRVVGVGKRLTGFSPGLDKKSALLALEGIDVSKYII